MKTESVPDQKNTYLNDGILILHFSPNGDKLNFYYL